MELRKKIGLILGFTFFFGFLVLPTPDNMNPLAMRALAVSALMAIFWVTEAIPVFVTSFSSFFDYNNCKCPFYIY